MPKVVPMFTELAPLSQRVERLIDETPKIDPHTHLRCDRPGAADLSALLGYHWMRSELESVGLPQADLDESLPVDERIKRILPYLGRMRNTAMSWCLRRILRDLYDFADPIVTPARLPDLLAKVAATGRDPNWARTVLTDRCRITTFVTSLGNAGPGDGVGPIDAKFMLDVHYLFCPGVATDLTPFFDGRTSKGEYYDALCIVLGDRPDTADRLEQLLRDWLGRTVTGRVRFSNTFIPIEQRFRPPDRSAAGRALARAAGGSALDDDEIDEIAALVVWALLGWHHDHRKAVQVAVGAEYFICDGKSIPRFQETWTTQMARAFHNFNRARFDLMMASDVLTHEVAVLARQFPNVYLSGYWWHNFFPSTIERIIRLRLEAAPMVKIGGFLCDAYSVEWTYGKLQVIKLGMVRALTGLVESRFLDEDELPELLKQILHDTPRDLYDLGDHPQ